MLKFQRLAKLSEDADVILAALEKCDGDLIEVDKEKKMIRRSPAKPLPEAEDEEAKRKRTCYAKGFDKSWTLDQLLEFFTKFDNVAHVNRRTFIDRRSKDQEKQFKGSVFVTFTDRESAEAFMKLESVKNPDGVELRRMWQADYFDEKTKEYEEKKAKQKAEKKQIKAKLNESKDDNDDAEEDEEEAEENKLPLGATLFMDGFDDTTMREDIKKELKEKFEVGDTAIAFVDFEKGHTKGHIRFSEENAAKNLVDKMGEAKLVVKEKEITVKLLEGDEERKYLDEALKTMKAHKMNKKNRGHKRRGGFGGGRGGRGGHGGKRFKKN